MIKKIDLGCHHVNDIDIIFNDGKSRMLAHTEDYVCTSKTFCNGDEWPLKEKRFIAPCDLSPPGTGNTIPIEINVDIGDDNVKIPINIVWIPDPNFEFPAPLVIPTKVPTPVPTHHPVHPLPYVPVSPDPDPTPTPTCEDDDNGVAVPDDPSPDPSLPHNGVECTKRADKLWFEFTGGACNASKNTQRKLKDKDKNKDKDKDKNKNKNKNKNLFTCEESENFNVNPSEVVLITINETPYSKKVGEHILILDGPTNMEVEINASSGEQTVTLHSSCSKNFAIGDTFGALRFVGFENSEQGLVYG